MTSLIVNGVSGALVVTGALFFLSGTVGLLRFPDIYSRLHVLTKADNVGLGFIALGVLIQSGSAAVAVQVLMTWGLALAAAATVCHVLARSALDAGVPAFLAPPPNPDGEQTKNRSGDTRSEPVAESE